MTDKRASILSEASTRNGRESSRSSDGNTAQIYEGFCAVEAADECNAKILPEFYPNRSNSEASLSDTTLEHSQEKVEMSEPPQEAPITIIPFCTATEGKSKGNEDKIGDAIVTDSKLIATPRLEWIDGFRGISMIIIFTHHFSDNTWATQHPELLGWSTPGSLLRYVTIGSISTDGRRRN